MSSNITKLDFLNTLGEHFGHLVYLGTGASGHLADFTAKTKNDIFIFEPVPSFYKALKSKTKKNHNVNVYNDWVISDSGEEEFIYTFNNPRFNSTCPPKKLLSKKINLKLIERKKCEGKCFSSLLNALPLISCNHNVLIMNLRGAERKVLAQVTCQLHLLFQTLVVILPHDGYYDCSEALPEIIGFKLERKLSNGSDTIVVFDKDSEKVALIEENTKYKKEIQELSENYESAKSDIERLQSEKQELAKKCSLQQQSIEQMKKETALLLERELTIQRRYYRLLNKTK
jgi:hypothetical protein